MALQWGHMQEGWLEEWGPGQTLRPFRALPAWLRPPCPLSQVSFQHEVYPVEPAAGPTAPGEELEEQPLSRQVFVVQELEIRDRLPSSKINKFLYMYTSERMPRRTHSNMVLWAGTGPRLHTCVHMHSHSPGLSASPGGWQGSGQSNRGTSFHGHRLIG